MLIATVYVLTGLVWTGRSLLEDAFGVGGASTFYVIGALGTLAGLIVLAAAFWIAGRRSSASVAALIAVGMPGMVVGMGWLVLVGCVLAARTHLAAQRQTGAAHA